tara:strand:- start:82352 stop:82579 length:228 start_codon:yes stop_codon:yes gene_type:complete
MKLGDLVKSTRYGQMGIVVEIFDDLNKSNPWVRVLFTHPVQTYQWCKLDGLIPTTKKEENLSSPLSGALNKSGSL